MKLLFFLILSVVGLSQGDKIAVVIDKFIGKCGNQGGLDGIMNCITEKSLQLVLKASEQKSLQILPGLEIISNTSQPHQDLQIQDLPSDPKKKQQTLLELLVRATSRLISNRVLKITLPNNTAEETSRGLEEGRAKKKKLDLVKFGLGAILFTAFSVMLAGVGFISAKAVVVGKIALALSVFMFAQSFFSNGRNMLPTPYGATPNYPNNNPGLPYGTNSLGWGGQQSGYPY